MKISSKNPNILLITIDQWRADCLSSAGHPLVQTPALDALASDGVRFANHYAQATPCGPSRASLHTGTYLFTHRSVFNGTPLDAQFTNTALEFRAGNYDPILFGYTDTTIDPRTTTNGDSRLRTYEGHLPGFRVVLPLPEDRNEWYKWLESRGYDISDRQRFLRGREDIATPLDRGSTWAPSPYKSDETETAFMVNKVIETLTNLPEPWFVHVSILRPHPPFVVPAPYHDRHDPGEVPDFLSKGSISHPFFDALSKLDFIQTPKKEIDRRQLRATYYGMVEEVDDQIGNLINFLDNGNQSENTAVIVTSDHGELLGDHGLVSKFGFYDQAFHIPMIIRYPALHGPTGLVVNHFTENIDIMPTLLDLAGLPIPDQCQGKSVRPFLEGKTTSGWRRAVHWEFDFRIFANTIKLPLADCHLAVYRDETGKLVHFAGMPDLFFDIQSDPGEEFPLTNHPVMSDYQLALSKWRPVYDDGPLTNLLATSEGMITLEEPELIP